MQSTILDLEDDVLVCCVSFLSFTGWVAVRTTCRGLNRVGLLAVSSVSVATAWPLHGAIHVHKNTDRAVMRLWLSTLLRSFLATRLQSLHLVQHSSVADSLRPGSTSFNDVLHLIVQSPSVVARRALSSVRCLRIDSAVNLEQVSKYRNSTLCPYAHVHFSRLLQHLPSLTAVHLTNGGTATWPRLASDTPSSLTWHPSIGPHYFRIFSALRLLPLRVLTVPSWASNTCLGHLLDADATEAFDQIPLTNNERLVNFQPCSDPASFALSLCARSLEVLHIEASRRSISRSGLLFTWIARLTQLQHLTLGDTWITDHDEHVMALASMTELRTLDMSGLSRFNNTHIFPTILTHLSSLTALGVDRYSARWMDIGLLERLCTLRPTLCSLTGLALRPGFAAVIRQNLSAVHTVGVELRSSQRDAEDRLGPMMIDDPLADLDILFRMQSLTTLHIRCLRGIHLPHVLLLSTSSAQLTSLSISVDQEENDDDWRGFFGWSSVQSTAHATGRLESAHLYWSTRIDAASPSSPSISSVWPHLFTSSTLTSLTICSPFIHRDVLAHIIPLTGLQSLRLEMDLDATQSRTSHDSDCEIGDVHLLSLQYLHGLQQLHLSGLSALTLLCLPALSFCRSLSILRIERCLGLTWTDRGQLQLLQSPCSSQTELHSSPSMALDVVHLQDNISLPSELATAVRHLIIEWSRAIRVQSHAPHNDEEQWEVLRVLTLSRYTLTSTLKQPSTETTSGLTWSSSITAAADYHHQARNGTDTRGSSRLCETELNPLQQQHPPLSRLRSLATRFVSRWVRRDGQRA